MKYLNLKEKAKDSREAKDKLFEDYHWTEELGEDVTKLKKLRVSELNNYHWLKLHLAARVRK